MKAFFQKYSLAILSSVFILFGAFNGYADDGSSNNYFIADGYNKDKPQNSSTSTIKSDDGYISGSGYGYGFGPGYGFGGDDNLGAACSLESMKKKYLSNDDVKSACWYCKIVIVLTNAYLNVAAKAIPTSVALGRIILKFGFLIWLAYYILQQVSSMKPITPGKFLQEILVMGLKVAVASLILGNAIPFISEYLLNPIIGFGTDYGIELLGGIQRTG